MKMICSQKRYGSMLPIMLLLPLLATGCGGQGKGTVSGKVTYQGKPLPSGFVTFVPEQGAALHSEIQSDGSYRMNNVPLGAVKISVEPKSAQDTLKSSAMPRNPKDFSKAKTAMTESDAKIPSRYADPNKSQLTYTVTKGSQQHDIDLK
jgi:hypothetical protein